MGRGGTRTPGDGKTLGRPKLERTIDPGVAANVLRKQKSEQLWNEIVETDTAIMRETKKTGPLRDDLRHLEDRAYGKPLQPVDHNAKVELSGRAVFVLERIGTRGKK